MVEGALEQPDLGLSEEDLHHVSEEVSIVFHTAATIKFDAPLRCVDNIFVVLMTAFCHKLINHTCCVCRNQCNS